MKNKTLTDRERLEQEVDLVLDHCKSLLFSKAKEYANDTDRLANFRQPTSMMKTNQAKVCLMYDMKHIASIVKIAEDIDKGIYPSEEMLLEKVGDYVNYGLLFYANVLEAMANEETE